MEKQEAKELFSKIGAIIFKIDRGLKPTLVCICSKETLRSAVKKHYGMKEGYTITLRDRMFEVNWVYEDVEGGYRRTNKQELLEWYDTTEGVRHETVPWDTVDKLISNIENQGR